MIEEIQTQTPPANQRPALAESLCSAPSFARRQDDLDWGVFAAIFEKRNGFAPHPRDTGHQDAFHWFTVGAHEEFMGRLNVLSNVSDQATARKRL